MTDSTMGTKRARGRSGCLNCRRRKKKCDERKPICTKCASRGETCKWDSGFTFRVSGIDAQHPSMLQSSHFDTNRVNTNDIMNVSFVRQGLESSQTQPHEAGSDEHDASAPSFSNSQSADTQFGTNIDRYVPEDKSEFSDMSTEDNTASNRQRMEDSYSPPRASETESTFCEDVRNDLRQNQSSQSAPSNYSVSQALNTDLNSAVEPMGLHSVNRFTTGTRHSEGFSAEHAGPEELDFAFGELEALDYLTSQPNNLLFPASITHPSKTSTWNPVERSDLWSPPFVDSPDTTMYYPSAAYKSLHSTLYHHMVEAARNTAFTQQNSPDRLPKDVATLNNDIPKHAEFNEPNTQQQGQIIVTNLSTLTKISRRRQSELWRNYLDEIALWLDMFDNERHFQLQIPHLAMSADHLHYSILALSARQIERKDPGGPHIESLGLYQEAIQLIQLELHTLDTAVIASCVLLCVLEMMSSSPRAWGRHLNGCAMLLDAAGVNGVVGGMRQSLFWCFARMDVWGGFLGDTLTMIPTSRWFVPCRTMVDAISHFKEDSGCDSYANYAVFLCASVVNVISDRVRSTTEFTYSARWKALFELLEDWYARRPRKMKPILSFPSLTGEHEHPFPTVLCSNSPAINGNQLYHAATLLMLQEKPKDVRIPKGTNSIFWHARQICGIAASNNSHGPWINALQPLWIAGKIMSHASEHNAIVEILAKIERETGWATAWRAQDLREYWGDTDG